MLQGFHPSVRTWFEARYGTPTEPQAMLRKPPHILVTTPESFYLLLTSGSGRGVLGTVRTVIVDEIHAVARDKRGAHLAISLERLDALCGHRCVRVGLSATQRPIEEIGRFLTGGRRGAATASLEWGIDVGAVRLVVQLESPRSFSVALQRIGRASHHRGGVPKGRLFPATRDQLVECAALVRGMRAGNLELTRIPQWPLDVLAQQLVAMAACEDLAEDEAYALVRRAWPYRELPRAEFDAVIEMHAEGVARRAGRAQGARLHRDGAHRGVKAPRGDGDRRRPPAR